LVPQSPERVYVVRFFVSQTSQSSNLEQQNHMNGPHKVCTVWLTGSSGAKMSAVTAELAGQLRALGRSVEVLEETEVRHCLHTGLGISRADNDRTIRSICYIASLLTRNGIMTVVASGSPYPAVRDENSASISDCVQIHLAGERNDLSEAPLQPAVVCNTELEQVAESASKIISVLEDADYLTPVSFRDESVVYSNAEEEIVRQRLEDLGYL
jgi:adenylylsulfate kinase